MANGYLGSVLQQPPARDDARATGGATDSDLLRRFVTLREEVAFETLVQRHGPMVLGVCRRILKDWHAAEDAFQATFLVLAQKAGSLSKPELLGNWLYGVAYRTAIKARARAARQGAHERQAATMPRAESVPEAAWQQLKEVLDEELQQLPTKYRAPLVLCYLEGKTHEDAARQLGWPVGSMSWYLARGRDMLRQRLNRRGNALSAGPFALMLSDNVAPLPVPAPLVASTVKAALSLGPTQGTTEQGQTLREETVSPAVSKLADEVAKGLWSSWLRVLAIAALLLCLAGVATGALAFNIMTGGPAQAAPSGTAAGASCH